MSVASPAGGPPAGGGCPSAHSCGSQTPRLPAMYDWTAAAVASPSSSWPEGREGNGGDVATECSGNATQRRCLWPRKQWKHTVALDRQDTDSVRTGRGGERQNHGGLVAAEGRRRVMKECFEVRR